MTDRAYHEPVLLDAVLEVLRPRPGALILDGTLGGGGHSAALLEAGAKVIGLDQDPEAIAFASARLREYGDRFDAVRANFGEATAALDERGISELDGILLDIGISSHQLNEPARGFSFMKNGPLDMRMDPAGPVSRRLGQLATTNRADATVPQLGEEPSARENGRPHCCADRTAPAVRPPPTELATRSRESSTAGAAGFIQRPHLPGSEDRGEPRTRCPERGL